MKIKKIIGLALVLALALCACAAGCKKNAEITYSDDPMFKAENWVYMTNNNGAGKDSGGIPCSLDDGTIKFHNANQAYNYGSDLSNGTVEFMLKASKNWQMWFLADTVDNKGVNCYKLVYLDNSLYFTTSESTSPMATVKVEDTKYKVNDWNKLGLSFSTSDKLCTINLTVNGEHVSFERAGTGGSYTVTDGNFVHTQSATFNTGNYISVKVWYGDCFLQLRSVDDEGKPEVEKIACIGDSITYGANADNSYLDSYPAQLQKLYGGKYNVMNFGKSGATVRDSADDPYRKTAEYAGAMLFKPDTAIIMLGSNDSKTYQVPTISSLLTAFAALADDLHALETGVKIYIATSPYAYSTAYNISNANIEKTVVPAQEQFAEENGLDLIPMHEYTKNMNGNYADGIHPTSKGYTYIAYRFYCELEDITPDEEYIASFKD